MKKLILLAACISFAVYGKAQPFRADFKKDDVTKVMKAVADWQIENWDKVRHGWDDWTNGALYVGMYAWGEMAEVAGQKNPYFAFLTRIGNRNGWQPGKRMYHADDICVAQMYIDMYRQSGKKNERWIMPTLARTDWVMKHPAPQKPGARFGGGNNDCWTWCDALFMAPPVYARLYNMTGEKRYMKFADKEFKFTYSELYDQEEKLFYRDNTYIGKQEKNGKKIFWGRGNGWVMGGLCEILQELPKKDRYRKYYEDLFKEMAASVVRYQRPSGYWSASLLDPESYPSPETSGTGFFVYALAYGVNEGLLPADEYMPAVRKGWKALVDAVEAGGKLGYVQPIGADPRKVNSGMTEVYGVGAFLLAGREIYKMSE